MAEPIRSADEGTGMGYPVPMRLRIHHVITRLIVGGAQENTLLTCRGLAARGHEVTLISGPETGPEGSLHDAARATGARLVIHPDLRREVAPGADLRETWELFRLFRRERPHVVHTHSSKAGIVGRVAAWAAGVPAVVHTNHGLPFHDSQPAWLRATYRTLEQGASRLCDRIVCVGEHMRRRSIEEDLGGPTLFTVVRSGMEVERFLGAGDGRPVRARLGLPEEASVVGTLGRLSPQKGPTFFLEAAERLALRFPNARFLWVGDGPLRRALESEARRRGLPIVFAGLVAPEAVAEHLAAMDVVLVTSLWEGLPRVAVQAMLSGRPVVAFDAEGVAEVVDGASGGRVVRRGDVDAMVEAVGDLLARPDRGREAAERNRARLAEEFRWQRMVELLERGYFDLLKDRV